MNIHSQPLNYTVNLCYKLAGGAYRARVTARAQLEWQPESSSFLSSGQRLGVCLAKYRMKNNTVGERINSLKETDSTINSSQLRAGDYTKMIYLTGKFGRQNTD